LHETVAAFVPDVRLKWPNDLVLQGAKISGILLEAGGSGTDTFVVVGIGVNLTHAPVNMDRAVTHLAAHMTGPAPEAVDFLHQLAASFAGWRTRWANEGFAPVRSYWLCHAIGLQQRVEARLGLETLAGTLLGMDETGALLLQLDSGGIRAVHAGEIFGI
jgi:BirA family transcriptional regulator, biotin operon repressor / biotin---[acetyl-CoA-carboxylase] ligase